MDEIKPRGGGRQAYNGAMTFTRPKLGAKAYLSRGPSGHNETFDRRASDGELELSLGGKAKQHIAVEGFIRKMLLDRRLEDWSDVIEYLAERMGVELDHVPVNIAVAFWAHVDEARIAAKAEKLAAQSHRN
jgi:hypothetical protein